MTTQAQQLAPANAPAWAVEYIHAHAESRYSPSGVLYHQVPNEDAIADAGLRIWVRNFNHAERERLNAAEYRSEATRFWLFGGVGVVAIAGLGYYVWKKRR